MTRCQSTKSSNLVVLLEMKMQSVLEQNIKNTAVIMYIYKKKLGEKNKYAIVFEDSLLINANFF